MKKEMTAENMQQVINENINLVSDKTRESFDAMSLEDQYKKILKLIANKKFQEKKKANKDGFTAVIDSNTTRFSIAIKKVFEKYHPTIADAEDLIRFSNEYIDDCKQAEIEHLTQEIERLKNLKEQLESEQE